MELDKIAGKLGLSGPPRDLEIKLRIEGKKSGSDAVDGVLSSFVELPVTGKSYVSYENSGHRANLRLGRWQESAAWEDSKEVLTLWYFASRDHAAAPAAEKTPTDALRLEMRWLKAASPDLAQIAKAQPETREKAALWLSGRAQLWKASVLRARADDKLSWTSSEGKLHLEDGQDVADEESLHLEGGYKDEGAAIRMNWKASVRKMRVSEEVVREISADAVAGKWNFTLIDGIYDANVLVYRLMKD